MGGPSSTREAHHGEVRSDVEAERGVHELMLSVPDGKPSLSCNNAVHRSRQMTVPDDPHVAMCGHDRKRKHHDHYCIGPADLDRAGVGDLADRSHRRHPLVRRATTAVAREPDPDEPAGEPVSVEVSAFDFVEEVEGPRSPGMGVGARRAPACPVFHRGSAARVKNLEGARNLIAALTELIEAVKEGTR